MRLVPLATVVVLAACAADDSGDDASGRCDPPRPVIPAGPLADPLAIPLPAECVPGGMRDAGGRWFLGDYPLFEGDCTQGFRRHGVTDDPDASDGVTYHQWSDGTRYVERHSRRYPATGPLTYEAVDARAVCLLPDGTLAGAWQFYNSDRPDPSPPYEIVGQRFAAKDGLADGLTLVGSIAEWTPFSIPITAYNVAVDAGHAFVVGPTGLDVIDVRDPATPLHVGHVDGWFNDVKIARGDGRAVAFVAGGPTGGTAAIDVTDPTAPTLAFELAPYSHSVFVAQRGPATLLYLATYTQDIPVYDVTRPLVPILIGDVPVPGFGGVHDLYAADDLIYVNDTTSGFVVLDVAGGLDAPIVRGQIPTGYSHSSWVGVVGGRTVALHGDEGGGALLRVLDGDPGSATFLAELGRYQSRPEVGIHNFQLVGDRAYIAYYQDGVRVVDLSDLARPREIAHYNTWDVDTAPGHASEGAFGIRVAGELIYAADSQRGLMILREP